MFANQLLSDVINVLACFSLLSLLLLLAERNGYQQQQKKSYSALLLTAFPCGKQ